MESELAQEAVNAALAGDWQKAIEINSAILKIDAENIDALNRIARAYAEVGNITKAKEATRKALKVDPQDLIANRCFTKWENFKGHDGVKSKISPDVFIENLSKIKIIDLVNLGTTDNFLNLECGDCVKLAPNIHRLGVNTQSDKYIGRFPDDLAAKYIRLIKEGNSYDVFIKSITRSQVKVLLKSAKNGL